MNTTAFVVETFNPERAYVALWGSDGEWQSVQMFVGPDALRAARETVKNLNGVLEAARTRFHASIERP